MYADLLTSQKKEKTCFFELSSTESERLGKLINVRLNESIPNCICSRQYMQHCIATVQKKQLKRLLLAFYRENLLGQLVAVDELRKEKKLKFLGSNGTQQLELTNVQLLSLNRIEITGTLYKLDLINGSQQKIDSIKDLISWVKENNAQILADDWQQFEIEINNSFYNEVAMLAYRDFWQNHLLQTIKCQSHSSLWSFVKQELNHEEQMNFFEQWGAIGHRYHPGSKTRLGLSDVENIQLSPEFQNEVGVYFAALYKDLAHIESMLHSSISYDNWIQHYYPDEYEVWCENLREKKLNPHDYFMIPVHPWQAKNILPSKFIKLIHQQHLLIFDQSSTMTKPSMSFRTMLPLHSQGIAKPHIKLPVAIHATSVMRTVSPESVKSGPRVSRLLMRILAKETEIARNMSVQADVFGFHVTDAPRQDDLRQLSAIFRLNPVRYLEDKEVIVPVASLFVETPIDKKLLICEILDAAGCFTLEATLDYFRRYCRIVLTACFDLYLLYGIALEAHQQNTLMVFEKDQPTRLIIRDLGGIRLHLPSLAETKFCLPEDTFSLTFTDSQTITRRKFMHACLQSHLGEFILQLSMSFGVEESMYWQIIADEIHKRFVVLKPRVSLKKWQAEYDAILKKDWFMKALTRMRLNDKLDCDKDDMQGDIYVTLPNPLKENRI